MICQVIFSESLTHRLLYVSVENLCINSKLSISCGVDRSDTGDPTPFRDRVDRVSECSLAGGA